MKLGHCHVCKSYRPAWDFYGDITRTSKLSSRCIDCEKERSVERQKRLSEMTKKHLIVENTQIRQ